MKNKSILLIAPLVLLAAFILSPRAMADPIDTGDLVLYVGPLPGHSAHGGAFQFTNLTKGFDFYTFCLEIDERIARGTTYYVVTNTVAVLGGIDNHDDPNDKQDPLDPKTAYIYKQWVGGQLSDYSQTELQNVIWFSEDEIASLTPNEQLLYDSAANASGLYDVIVLNLYKLDDTGAPNMRAYAQDILFTPIPEPSTIFLLGVGLAGIGVIARKKTKK